MTVIEIWPGEIEPERAFAWHPSDGLERLRRMAANLCGCPGHGIIVKAQVGLASHVGDILRSYGIPSRMEF